MNLLKRMVILLGLVLYAPVPVPGPVPAQTIENADDGTTLKQIILWSPQHTIIHNGSIIYVPDGSRFLSPFDVPTAI